MSGKKTPAPVLELALGELEAFEAHLKRAEIGEISRNEYTKLKALIYTFAWLREELRANEISIATLRRMLFGPRREPSVRCSGRGWRA